MPEFLPTPQQPTGLAEAIARLIAQRGQTWGEAAHGFGQNLGSGIYAKMHPPAPTTLTPEQATATGFPGTAPGKPLPPGSQGPVQPQPLSNVFPKGVPMTLVEEYNQRKMHEAIAKETTERTLSLQGLKGDQAAEKTAPQPVNQMHKDQYKTVYGHDIPFSEITPAQEKQLADQYKSKTAPPKGGTATANATNKRWSEFTKYIDASGASSRSLFGVAGTINARADRALKTLESKDVTVQQLHGIAADIAGILKGGTPDEQAEKAQGYGTAYSDLQGFKQWITGKPTDAVPDAIKEKLRNTIMELKKVDNDIISKRVDLARGSYEDLSKADQKRFESQIQKAMKFTETSGSGKGKYDDVITKVMGGGS